MDSLGERIDAQGSRIDAQGRDLVSAIQAQGLELGSRIDALAARMDDPSWVSRELTAPAR
jgi:hypothetical protein